MSHNILFYDSCLEINTSCARFTHIPIIYRYIMAIDFNILKGGHPPLKSPSHDFHEENNDF
jgi:hypothetical protein